MAIIHPQQLYTMGIDKIQETHENEINMLNEISTLATKYQIGNLDLEDLESKIDEYIEHVKKHFQTEEDLMKEHNYPSYEMHKMAHDMFLSDLNYATMIWKKNNDLEKIIVFIRKTPEWLISHVNTVDKPTDDYISNKLGIVQEDEISMSLDEIQLELELAGVSRDKQVKLLRSIKREGFNPQAIDKKLALMGYMPIFTIYD